MKKILLIAICFLMIILSACSSDETNNISDEVTSSSVEADSTATKQETINNDIDAEFKSAMDSYEDFDYEITNDTLEKLKEDVYKIYQEETK